MKYCLLALTLTCTCLFLDAQDTAVRPFVLGQMRHLHSAVLGEDRLLNIYLPEGYSDSSGNRYPVTYLLDGSADEDFIHTAGLYQFSGFPWVNRVAPTIVVGIANVNRMRDFTFPATDSALLKHYPASGHSADFISFLEKEVQPFIEQQYKTNGTRTLIGESLGGLLATQILLQHTPLFNRYIIISPSLWWNNESLLRQTTGRLSSNTTPRIKIYIGTGKEGLPPGKTTRTMQEVTRALAAKLKAANPGTATVFFDYMPTENHATVSYQATYNALRLLKDTAR